MYNILIFGTGSTADVIEEVLKYDNVNILAYVDNDISKWNKFRKGKKIISPSSISDFDYDYIVIASQYNETIYSQLLNMNISSNRIFQFYKYYILLNDSFEKRLNGFIANINSVKGLLTGISYAETGVIPGLLSKNIYKFSLASQDIFYDYKIVEYILNNYNNNKIRYVIIGLSYYSFQYDLSLSAMRYKVSLYYNILKESHNCNYMYLYYQNQFDENKLIAERLINRDKKIDFKWNSKKLSDLNLEDRIELGKRQANIDCNKNYPETVKENIKIFRNYLELLRVYEVKPIVVVFPASKYYTKYFSKKIEEECYSIIDKFKNEYEFQYLDYFRSNLFKDEDFRDVSHLNKKGAEKFTKILDKDINW